MTAMGRQTLCGCGLGRGMSGPHTGGKHTLKDLKVDAIFSHHLEIVVEIETCMHQTVMSHYMKVWVNRASRRIDAPNVC